jgi:multidrug resistance protein, MATE family
MFSETKPWEPEVPGVFCLSEVVPEMTPTTIKPELAQTASPSMRAEAVALLALSWPIICTMISRMLLGFTDFIFVSRLGTDATAAISPSTIFVFTALCLGMGAATSIQTFVAQAMGRRLHHEAASYAWQGFYIAALFAIFSWPASWLAQPFWMLVGNAPAVQELEVAYCQIAVWCMGFSIICASLDGFFNGIQKPTVGLISIAVSLVFNAAANYLLVFGKLGFPALGIRGSAIATVIAWGIRAGMLTAVFLSMEFNERFRTRTSWRLNFAKFGGILRMGGPIAIQWVLDIGSWFVFLTLLMGEFGTQAMAASNIGLQLMHTSFMPAIGLGIGMGALIGHAIGERNPDLAVRRATVGMWMTGAYMGAIGLVFWLARTPLMKLLSDDPEVIRLGASVLIWAGIFQVFDAAQITYVSALRGAGDTRWPAIAVALHCWVIFIGGGYLLARCCPQLGLNGPWMTCTLYITLLGLVLWRRFARGAWRKIDLFKGGPPSGGFPVTSADGEPDVPTMISVAPPDREIMGAARADRSQA